MRCFCSSWRRRRSREPSACAPGLKTVNNRGLCAISQAESLRFKLLGGLALRRYFDSVSFRMYDLNDDSFIEWEEVGQMITEYLGGDQLFQVLSKPEEALKLLQKAVKLLKGIPGQYRTIAGIKARMGQLQIYYLLPPGVERMERL
ncbi:hypothetical protein P8452_38870 [Trifolium repens]|nr:hypothetical protein P8452_38870 [Trifolium repens]